MDPIPGFPKRRSVRLKGFDYAQPGLYFVTICSRNRECLFGQVIGGAVKLNRIGRIVQDCWLEIPRHFAGLELDAHVVMPNHVHGILVMNRRARRAVPLRPVDAPEAFGRPLSGSLPTIIRSFKAAVSRRLRADHKAPAAPTWQRGYYERVIRNGEELEETRRYIWENPQRWEADEENPTQIATQS